MTRANAPSLRGTEHQLRSEDQGGRNIVLRWIIDVTSKHLSILGIAEKLGDAMRGLALIAVPSLLKYHSRVKEEGHLHDINGIWCQRTHCWHSRSRKRRNPLPIEGDRVGVLLQLSQSFQCQTRRFAERLDNK